MYCVCASTGRQCAMLWHTWHICHICTQLWLFYILVKDGSSFIKLMAQVNKSNSCTPCYVIRKYPVQWVCGTEFDFELALQQCNSGIATVQWWECFIWVTRSCQHAAGQSVKIASIRENSEYYSNPIFDIFGIFVQILSCKNGCSNIHVKGEWNGYFEWFF